MDAKDVPSFGELKSLTDLAKAMGNSIATMHRWRLASENPLECWLIGRHWHSTEEALRDFIRNRTAAANACIRGEAEPAPAAAYTQKRQHEIKAAVAECERLGC